MARTPHTCPLCECDGIRSDESGMCFPCDGTGIVWEGKADEVKLAPVRSEAVGPPKPACANCKHFDLEEGQATMFSDPRNQYFARAAQVLPPALMGRELKFDAEGNRLPEEEQPELSVPMKTKWQDIGACLKHNEGRANIDVCDEHEVQA